MKRLRSRSGFTLIELVGSIVILGLLALIGTLGIINVIDGYRFAANNAELSQKAETALMRMTIELSYLVTNGILSGTATSINYRSDFGSGNEDHTLSLSGSQIQLDTITLTDLVDGGGFQLLYYASDGVTQVSPASAKIIGISLTLRGANNLIRVFITRVALRS